MSYAEYIAWLHYRERRGPLNPMLRAESGFALIAACLTGKRQADFMPFVASSNTSAITDDGLLEMAKSGTIKSVPVGGKAPGRRKSKNKSRKFIRGGVPVTRSTDS